MCGDRTQAGSVLPVNLVEGGSAPPRMDKVPCSPTLVLSEENSHTFEA